MRCEEITVNCMRDSFETRKAYVYLYDDGRIMSNGCEVLSGDECCSKCVAGVKSYIQSDDFKNAGRHDVVYPGKYIKA